MPPPPPKFKNPTPPPVSPAPAEVEPTPGAGIPTVGDVKWKEIHLNTPKGPQVRHYSTLQVIHATDPNKAYTYKVLRADFEALSEHDLVLTLNNGGVAIGEVFAKDFEPQDNGDFKYRWVFQKVDLNRATALDKM